MRELIDALVDDGSFFEVHKRWAKELIVGYARLDGRAVGIVANQPKFKGGVLFVDSADKAARFIWTCNAFNIPLLFLADVPGFMIGTAVERQGIIRHGAKMISAVSEATVPKISVIVRKAYGAGLYAMSGPGVRARRVHRAAERQDRGDGPEAAVNAVFYNQLAAIEDEAERAAKRAELMDGVRRGHRPAAPRVRARDRRGRRSPRTCATSSCAASRTTRGARRALAAQAQRGPARLGRAARAAQPVDLVLLAHDQVLHQVLERLRARLLAGVRDHARAARRSSRPRPRSARRPRRRGSLVPAQRGRPRPSDRRRAR